MTDDDIRAYGTGGDPWPAEVDTKASRVKMRVDERLDRVGLRSAFARDCLLAVVVLLISSAMVGILVGVMAGADGVRFTPTTTAALTVLMCTQSLTLCVRRSHPALCLLVVTVLQVGIVAFLPPYVAAHGISMLITAYTCGTLLPPRRLVQTLGAVLILQVPVGTLVTGTLSDPLLSAGTIPFLQPSTFEDHLAVAGALLSSTLFIYVGSALVGVFMATRRRHAELMRIRAAEVVQRQRERTEAAIMGERTRMARELHDIAAHHLSGMVVQAGAAERLIGHDDEAAREATSWVRSQGKETLDSLRLVVGALRDPGEEPASSGDGLSHTGNPEARGAPVPRAAALERLVQTERNAGCSVDLVREGEPYDLPPVADITIYRVAQEALSNAREHAPNAPVRLLLHHRDTRVVLEAENAAAATAAAGDGHRSEETTSANVPRGLGLLGMQERAHLVGAELAAGPTSAGGWRVRLDLPVSREISSARNRTADKERA